MKISDLSPWIWLLVTVNGFAFYFFVLIDLLFFPVAPWPAIGGNAIITKGLLWIQFIDHCRYFSPIVPVEFLLVTFSILTGFSVGRYYRTQESHERFSRMSRPLIVSIVVIFSTTITSIFLFYWIISISLDLPTSIFICAPSLISMLFIISVILGKYRRQQDINKEEQIYQNSYLLLLIALIVIFWFLSLVSTMLFFHGYPCQ